MYIVLACLNTDFAGSPNTSNICLILSIIYIFIRVSGCVGNDPSPLVFPGPMMLVRRPWLHVGILSYYDLQPPFVHIL